MSQWSSGARSTDMLVETFSQSHPRVPAVCEARTTEKPERGGWFVQPLPGMDHLSVVPFPHDTHDQRAFFNGLVDLILQMHSANGPVEIRRSFAATRTTTEANEVKATSVTARARRIHTAAARVLVGILSAVGVAALFY